MGLLTDVLFQRFTFLTKKEKLYKCQTLQVLFITLMHTAEIPDNDRCVTNAGKMQYQITLKSN